MAKRVAKGNILPSINPIVDLGNSLSLKYVLPMGAHDLDALADEIAVRFSVKGDLFTPLGTEDIEILEKGELVYADTKRIINLQRNVINMIDKVCLKTPICSRLQC